MPEHQPPENTTADLRVGAVRSPERPQIPDHELLRPIGAAAMGKYGSLEM